MERWDAYDRDFNRIEGVALVRGLPVPEGLFHLVVEILVHHTDGDYLLMQRDFRKHFGGMWEASGGGSVLQGETPYEGALRELREETGIRACSLTEIGRFSHGTSHCIYYLCETDCPKDSIMLQEYETVDWRWISAEELKDLPDTVLVPGHIRDFVEELH